MPQLETKLSAPSRMLLVDALRALAATMIAWHHFAYFGLMPFQELSVPAEWQVFLWDFRWAVQVFFVIGGFLMARSLARRTPSLRQVGRFVVHRYCRLGLPYLVTLLMAIMASAFGRGWLPEAVVDDPPTLGQILAHLVFLQDILGYESLSAGLWYICIDFQLALVYVSMWYLHGAVEQRFRRGSDEPANDGPTVGVPVLLGWALAMVSLFYFNRDEYWDVWAVYFFGHFFMGVMVFHGLRNARSQFLFGLYAVMIVAALVDDWRPQLATTLVTGLVLFSAGKLGLLERWPTNRLVANQGRTSYSLFLVHFPVLVVVSTVCIRLDWTSQTSAIASLAVAYLASLAVAAGFYRAVEAPAERLSRKIG